MHLPCRSIIQFVSINLLYSQLICEELFKVGLNISVWCFTNTKRMARKGSSLMRYILEIHCTLFQNVFPRSQINMLLGINKTYSRTRILVVARQTLLSKREGALYNIKLLPIITWQKFKVRMPVIDIARYLPSCT